ncbi:MAG: FAD-dependent oxidoreductase [Mycobacteriaceae bacterium]
MALLSSGERRQQEVLAKVSVPEFWGRPVDSLSPQLFALCTLLVGQFGTDFPNVSAKTLQLTTLLITGWMGTQDAGFYRGRLAGAFDDASNAAMNAPWGRHLESLGAQISMGHKLVGLDCKGKEIVGARVQGPDGKTVNVEADWYVMAMPPDKAAPLMSDSILTADPRLDNLKKFYNEAYASVHLYYNKPRHSLVEFAFGDARGPKTKRWWWGCIEYTDLWNVDFAEKYGDGSISCYVTCDMVFQELWPGHYGRRLQDMTSKQQLLDEMTYQYAESGINLTDGLIRFEMGPQFKFGADGKMYNDERCWAMPVGGHDYLPDNDGREIRNLLWGSSLANTSTQGDGLDGAVEGGRRATNAILDATDARSEHAWVASGAQSSVFRRLWDEDNRRFDAQQPNMFDVSDPYRGDF